MVYLHPVLGALAAASLVWLSVLGLRSRHRAAYAREARATHRRFAWWIYGAIVLSAVGGTASVLLLRDDLDLGTAHFWTGWATVALMTAGAITSRRLPAARQYHLGLGLGALVLALAGVALGFRLLP